MEPAVVVETRPVIPAVELDRVVGEMKRNQANLARHYARDLTIAELGDLACQAVMRLLADLPVVTVAVACDFCRGLVEGGAPISDAVSSTVHQYADVRFGESR